MGKSRNAGQERTVVSTPGNNTKDESIAERYSSRPSPRALAQSGQIDRKDSERAERVRAFGAAGQAVRQIDRRLGAERERQGLSLADLAERTGMDRAAIHKLEIGLNSNPTHSTFTRYAEALGARIEWKLKTIPKKSRGA